MLCNCFTSSPKTFVSYAANDDAIVKTVIKNAIFDVFYATVASVDINNFDGNIPSIWTFDTRIYVQFNGDLYGGNVSFTESIVELVRIKKRTAKDTKFQTIYEKPINHNEDFAIEMIDYMEPIGTIEYAYVPVISGGESSFIITRVESKFDSCFLVEKDKSYPIILDSRYTETINYETGQIKPLGSKYPVIVVNGNTGYKSGDIEGTFIEKMDGDFDVNNSFDYRHLVYDFLTNSNPKIFKDFDSNLLMINITGNISESSREFAYYGDKEVYYVKSKFSYVECGDPYYVGDLYDNNFIDSDTDR